MGHFYERQGELFACLDSHIVYFGKEARRSGLVVRRVCFNAAQVGYLLSAEIIDLFFCFNPCFNRAAFV